MTYWPKLLLPLVFCAALLPCAASTAQPALNSEQQTAVGIVVAHPVTARFPPRIDSLGVVLDPTLLLSESGEAMASGAAHHSAMAEVARLTGLYKGGAGASLKMLEAAQAEYVKAAAQSQSAAARFALHWGPVASMPPLARQRLLRAAADGHSLLLRADMPGRHSLGALPSTAIVDVDGVQVPGRILGVLRQSTELQSVGLLVEATNVPVGLGPGARVPVALQMAAQSGLAVPRDAVLYDENGAYVYKRVAGKPSAEKTSYTPVKVSLLMPYGDGWMVKGLDDDDDIVVHGAGVLWSLQGVDAHAVDDDD